VVETTVTGIISTLNNAKSDAVRVGLAVHWFIYMIFIRHYSQQNTTQIKEKKKGQTVRYIQ